VETEIPILAECSQSRRSRIWNASPIPQFFSASPRLCGEDAVKGYHESVDPLLSYLAARQREIVALIGEFAACESPSDHPAEVNRFVELVSRRQVRQAPVVRNEAAGP
jgi:hypothetical protein